MIHDRGLMQKLNNYLISINQEGLSVDRTLNAYLLNLSVLIKAYDMSEKKGNETSLERNKKRLDDYLKNNAGNIITLSKDVTELKDFNEMISETIDIEHSEDKRFYEVQKKEKNSNTGCSVSLKDGGVVFFPTKESPMVLINTMQAQDLLEDYEASKNKALFLDELSCGLSISNVENFDVDKYSWFKKFTLSNGESFELNSVGALVEGEYLSFEELKSEFKDRVDLDAQCELNKYCVKQDTGTKSINPFNLNVNDLNMDDIVTALSGINRFAGQTKSLNEGIDSNFYTVGQHTLAMYDAIKNSPQNVGLENESVSSRDKLAKMALIHEAFEGITGTDLITPFKYASVKNEYKVAEVAAEEVMEKVFDMPLMTSELKKIDKMMAATEGHYLVGKSNTDWSAYATILPKEVLKVGLSQEEVKNQLMDLYEKEGLNEVLDNYRYEFNKNLVSDKIFEKKMQRYGYDLDRYGLGKEFVKGLCLLRDDGLQKTDFGHVMKLETGSDLEISEAGVYIDMNGEKIAIDVENVIANGVKLEIEQKMKLDFMSEREKEQVNIEEVCSYVNNKSSRINIGLS